MPSFSQRKGLKPLQKLVQLDSIDEDLRNRLWNVLYDWVLIDAPKIGWPTRHSEASRAHRFACRVWGDFFKQPSDAAPDEHHCANPLRQHFENAEWNEVYDLMEFSVSNLPPVLAEPITKQWNRI